MAMRILLICLLCAGCARVPETVELPTQAEMDALNVYPTTDSAKGYALMMAKEQ